MSRELSRLRADLGSPLTLGGLADWAGASFAADAAEELRRSVVGGLAADSRVVESGDVFCALTGSRVDGHDFLDRLPAGTAAALVSRPRALSGLTQLVVDDVRRALLRIAAGFRDRFPELRVVGITGSVGKTSTKDYLGRIMADYAPSLVTAGNLNTEVGVPLTLARLTPEHRFAVLELGMQWAGEIQELARASRPQIGVVTAVGPSHLEFFDSVRGIARAKAELLEELPSTGFAVLPVENEHYEFLRGFARCRVITFGLERGDCRAEELHETPEGLRFELVWEPPAELGFVKARARIDLPRPGYHQALSALRAAAAALLCGVPLERAARSLNAARLTPQRGDVVNHGSLVVLQDAYNANPLSMEAALRTLAALPGRRRVAVLGDMLELGPAAEELHHEVGALVARLGIDVLVAVGGLAAETAAGAREAGMSRVYRARDRAEARERLLEVLRPGDVLLAKASNALELDRLLEELPEI